MSFTSSGAEDPNLELARVTRRDTIRKVQLRLASHRLGPLLEDLGDVLTAQRRLDAHPAGAPDRRDVDVLVAFAEQDWPRLGEALSGLPREAWPSGADQVERAVAGVRETLHRLSET
jgi:hypothetical protein